MKNKHLKRLLSVLLVICMLLTSICTQAFALFERTVSEMTVNSISDMHVYPEALIDKTSDEWNSICRLDSKLYNESETILRTALETIGQKSLMGGSKIVLCPGDLTRDSELIGHQVISKIFDEYAAKYALRFFVTVGNHDIADDRACSYATGTEEKTPAITPAQFAEVYKNHGFAQAIDRYAYPENGDKIQGALSYVADLDENYRLISVDSCIYSFDGAGKMTTEGKITPELMDWIRSWAQKTKDENKVPILMMHHNIAPHMEVEKSISKTFVLDDFLPTAEEFAKIGINYVFSGHLHTNDVASISNDDGEPCFDIETDSLSGFPNTYRESTFKTNNKGQTEVKTDALDFDGVCPFTYDGKTYEKGTFKFESFNLCFGGGLNDTGKADSTKFLVGIVKHNVRRYLDKINKMGIMPFLKSMNLDLESIIGGFLKPYIGEGIKIGSYKIFTTENIMWFVEDLLGQICDLYVKNPDALYAKLEPVVKKLTSFVVSDVPCSKFVDTLGFGSKTEKGTLGDMLLDVMTYWYLGNEDPSDDAFLLDAIKNFEDGDQLKQLFNLLIDVVFNDIVDDMLLSKIEIRVDKLLNDHYLQQKLGEGINYLLNYVLKGDFTYKNLVDTVFAMGFLPYNSLFDILDQLAIKPYLTDTQLQGIGQFVGYALRDFAFDSDPDTKSDFDVTLKSEAKPVSATKENYRIPSMISVTPGDDSEHETTVSFFAKPSLDPGIEVKKANSEPRFSGEYTASSGITVSTNVETVKRSFPGIDLGVIGFSSYEFDLKRVTCKISGLEPGEKYYYRVGDKTHDWWSDAGSFITSDKKDTDTTFIHLSDPQSQNARQYNEAWVKVLKSATSLYPDAKFIANSGDLVDHGDNNNQWQAMFDTGARYLQNIYMLPASGNHEGKGKNATVNYFALPNVPQQDTTSGVYYSFDYNDIHFAVLNTNDLSENKALSDSQVKWLTNDMNNSNAKWKFVLMHKALYSQGSHYKDKDVCALREQLGELMPKLKIDMAFEGHDHVYMRTASLDKNEKVATNSVYLERGGDVYKTQDLPQGTTYVISGCSGVKTYVTNDASKTDEYFPRAEKIMSVDAPMFSAIEIKDGVLYFNAYGVKDDQAVLADRFAIRKDQSQGTEASNPGDAEEQDEEQSAKSSICLMLEKILKVFKTIFRIVCIYVFDMKPSDIVKW